MCSCFESESGIAETEIRKLGVEVEGYEVDGLQSKLLKAKDAQLETIGKRVEESVKTSLQTEMQTHSDSVSKHSGPSITPAEARKIATTISKEEERASHVMLFGVEEKKAKISSGRFSEYFRRLARSLLLRELLLIALRLPYKT